MTVSLPGTERERTHNVQLLTRVGCECQRLFIKFPTDAWSCYQCEDTVASYPYRLPDYDVI